MHAEYEADWWKGSTEKTEPSFFKYAKKKIFHWGFCKGGHWSQRRSIQRVSEFTVLCALKKNPHDLNYLPSRSWAAKNRKRQPENRYCWCFLNTSQRDLSILQSLSLSQCVWRRILQQVLFSWEAVDHLCGADGEPKSSDTAELLCPLTSHFCSLLFPTASTSYSPSLGVKG